MRKGKIRRRPKTSDAQYSNTIQTRHKMNNHRWFKSTNITQQIGWDQKHHLTPSMCSQVILVITKHWLRTKHTVLHYSNEAKNTIKNTTWSWTEHKVRWCKHPWWSRLSVLPGICIPPPTHAHTCITDFIIDRLSISPGTHRCTSPPPLQLTCVAQLYPWWAV